MKTLKLSVNNVLKGSKGLKQLTPTNAALELVSRLMINEVVIKSESSVMGLEAHKLYSSKNYSSFNIDAVNRNGIDVKRVKYFIEQFQNGTFVYVLGTSYVNRIKDDNGKTKLVFRDGVHKAIAQMLLGLPIVYMILNEEVSADMMAHFNSSVNPKWSVSDHFSSALAGGYSLAIEFDKIINNAVNNYGLAVNKIKPSELFGLVKQSTKHFGGGMLAPQRGDYNSDTMAEQTKSEQFKDLLDAFIRIKIALKYDRDCYKVTKETFNLHFNKTMSFNLTRFVRNIEQQTIVHDSKVNSIRKEILRVSEI